MKKLLRPAFHFSPVSVKYIPLLAFIFWLSFMPESVWAQAAKQPTTTASDLQQFAGTYYLLGNQNLSLEISAPDNGLVLKELWSNRGIKFTRKADLNFMGTADPNFTLDFVRDKTGAISQVTAFKRDVWLKAKPQSEKLSPETLANRTKTYRPILNAFADAVNANTPDKIQNFIKAYVDQSVVAAISTEHLTQQLRNVYRSTGGIDLYTPKPFQPETGTATFKGRSLGNLCQISFSLNAEGKITNYSYNELREYALTKKPASEKELQETLAKAFDDLAHKDLFSGTVLVANGNKILFTFATGEKDKKTHAKNTLDTRFNLGSMNKMFTATAMMQLVEKGKLRLQDPIGKYLDTTWLPRAVSGKVTIHQLLSHTSGIRDAFWEFFDKAPRTQFWKLAGYKPFTKTLTLVAEPGANWAYNNTGMLLAGIIIQQVSGLNYFEYVRQNIYQPAGMLHTDVFEIDDHPKNVAIGYVPLADGSYQHNINMPFTLGSPAGGGYSTVQDLYKFAFALQAGKLVSEASRAKMFTDYKQRQYGYGFEVRQTPAGKLIGHGGGAPGVNAVLYILPETGYVLAVMANYDRAAQLAGNYLLSQIQTLPTNTAVK